MQRKRKWWLAAGAAALVAAGICLAAWPPTQGPTLVVDQAQVRAMLPAITAYLQSPAYRDFNGGYSLANYPTQQIKWLCNAAVVEIRSDGTRWRVGMDVACGDYARRGNTVIMEDGGDMGHEVIVLFRHDRRYEVLSAVQEPGVSPDPAWIDQNFSAVAAAEINNGNGPMASWPDSKALRAFNCKPACQIAQ